MYGMECDSKAIGFSTLVAFLDARTFKVGIRSLRLCKKFKLFDSDINRKSFLENNVYF